MNYGNVLSPSGPGAVLIAHHAWLLIGVCAVVEIVTLAAFLIALGRRGAPEQSNSRAWVGAAVVGTTLILSGFVAASFLTDRALGRMESSDPYTHVEIVAHQWWWEIRYAGWEGGPGFVTANELHLPAGRPVALQLSSPDVIHSFWIPALDRKRDVIPGHEQAVELTAAHAGVFRGRCAEFCGYQHAHMDVIAIVEPAEDFNRWRAQQAEPARVPDGELESRGAAMFARGVCGTCHVIRGSDSPGYSATAPDLTHLASRMTLAAGLLPNSAEDLAAWISDPQHFKPGAKMNVNAIDAPELGALVAYLETLR